jgi:hypothetical protein
VTSTNYEVFLQGDNQKCLQRQPQLKLASVQEVVRSVLPKVYSTTASRIISEHNLQEQQFEKKKVVSHKNLCSIVQQLQHITSARIRRCRSRIVVFVERGAYASLPICRISCKRSVLPQASISVSCNLLHQSSHKSVSEHFVLTHLLFMFSPHSNR